MKIIGSCDLCHGPVLVPKLIAGDVSPTCGNCGAVAIGKPPVIHMTSQEQLNALQELTNPNLGVPFENADNLHWQQ